MTLPIVVRAVVVVSGATLLGVFPWSLRVGDAGGFAGGTGAIACDETWTGDILG